MSTKIKEQEDPVVTDVEALTEAVGALALAIEHLNAVTLVLLYNQKLKGLSLPDWKDKETVERCVGEELSQCIKLMTNLKEANGPSPTSLSS